jgi:Kef-type K+ transport system membrane component KefB
MDLTTIFLTLGGLFLAGLFCDVLARRTGMPQVTLLLAVGVVAGGSGLGLIPPGFDEIFSFLSIVALTLVAFLLGNAPTWKKLRANGRMILWVSWSIAATTLVGVTLQAEALGLVFLTAGLCSWLGVSYLLAGLVSGTVIANVATHHDRAFHEIEHVQWPFLLLFFLMAGAVLDLGQLSGRSAGWGWPMWACASRHGSQAAGSARPWQGRRRWNGDGSARRSCRRPASLSA